MVNKNQGNAFLGSVVIGTITIFSLLLAGMADVNPFDRLIPGFILAAIGIIALSVVGECYQEATTVNSGS
jgi:uncharacterized BrkB/YihY/UPF0761 family membrane protein